MDGLLNTYPYNYNLGIDDHPIQRWAEKQQLTRKGLCSIILMPQMLRISRITRNIATLLERDEDAEQYYQVTACYDVIILKKSVDKSRDALALTLGAPCLDREDYDLLINMGQGRTRYVFMLNGQSHGTHVSDENGHISLRLPRPSAQDELLVNPVAG